MFSACQAQELGVSETPLLRGVGVHLGHFVTIFLLVTQLTMLALQRTTRFQVEGVLAWPLVSVCATVSFYLA